MRLIGEAGQELGEGRGGLSLLASPEILSPCPPLSPRPYCMATCGTLRLQLLGRQWVETGGVVSLRFSGTSLSWSYSLSCQLDLQS